MDSCPECGHEIKKKTEAKNQTLSFNRHRKASGVLTIIATSLFVLLMIVAIMTAISTSRNYYYDDYVTVVTPTDDNYIVMVNSINDNLLVGFEDDTGAVGQQSDFGFVTFKL